MKHAANIISISRIVLTLTLICFNGNKPLFIVLYIICGLSDVIDGYIARKTKTESTFGAKLDSLADLFMFGTVLALFIIWWWDKLDVLIPLLAAIALIRGINMAIAAYKYHSFVILHTLGNKAAGLLIFLAPLLYAAFNRPIIIWAACTAAALSAIEELLIHATSKRLDINRKSIFHRSDIS